jgi:hypothetical protein
MKGDWLKKEEKAAMEEDVKEKTHPNVFAPCIF